jgi:hypothetical protein
MACFISSWPTIAENGKVNAIVLAVLKNQIGLYGKTLQRVAQLPRKTGALPGACLHAGPRGVTHRTRSQ